jgi:hypothetical protein
MIHEKESVTSYPKTLLFDNALLVCISADSIVVLTELTALHLTQELLVVSDNDELEIRLMTSVPNNLVQ